MYPAGAESMLMNLYRHIDRNQVQFDFAVHTKEKDFFDEEIHHLGGRIYYVPRYNGKNHRSYVKVWQKLFDQHPEWRIIHSHIRSTASIFFRIAKRSGRVTIAHSHSTSDGYGIMAVAKRILELPLRKIADFYFACSLESGKWLFGKKIVNNKNFYILKNAIDTERFQFSVGKRTAIRQELGIQQEIVIGHVGRFIEAKNHTFIIQIFYQLLKHTDAKLILAGSGKLMEQIQAECRHLEIDDKVYFLGNRADIDAFLSAIDIFLFPSLYEGLPVTLVEAQASGLPCLVSSHITKEVDLGNIYRMDLETEAAAWAEKLLELTQLRKDRNSVTAKIKESGFDVTESAKWLQNFYESIG